MDTKIIPAYFRHTSQANRVDWLRPMLRQYQEKCVKGEAIELDVETYPLKNIWRVPLRSSPRNKIFCLAWHNAIKFISILTDD